MLTDAHRLRLLAAGAEEEVLDGLRLREAPASLAASLPAWWHELGNALYVTEDASLPVAVLERMATYPFSDGLLVLASPLPNLSSLLLGGDGATVFVGPDSELTGAELYCGGGSSIVLNGGVTATRCAIVDARNGGSIVAATDQLWAADVYLATDDMHALVDLETGVRLNPYGGRIRLGHHVWLGRDVVVTGHVDIGDGAVVGLRSLVRGQKVAANTAVAGTPARVIREGVAWSEADLSG